MIQIQEIRYNGVTYVTTRRAASRLGVHAGTIRRYVVTGRLKPAARVGRVSLYREADVTGTRPGRARRA